MALDKTPDVCKIDTAAQTHTTLEQDILQSPCYKPCQMNIKVE